MLVSGYHAGLALLGNSHYRSLCLEYEQTCRKKIIHHHYPEQVTLSFQL